MIETHRVPPAIEETIRDVCRHFQVTPQMLLFEKSQHAPVTAARRRLCLLWYKQGFSMPLIARYLRIHHTSVMYHVSELRRQMRQKRIRHYVDAVGEVACPDLSGEWAI